MDAASKTDKLIEWLLGEIESGRLRPGDRIPSGRELREQHGVSVTVVRIAIDRLKERGVLASAPGVGVFVTRRGGAA